MLGLGEERETEELGFSGHCGVSKFLSENVPGWGLCWNPLDSADHLKC